jgi:hypothetical protein
MQSGSGTILKTLYPAFGCPRGRGHIRSPITDSTPKRKNEQQRKKIFLGGVPRTRAITFHATAIGTMEILTYHG